MGVLNFEKLPISTLVGADRKTFDKVMEGVERERGYRRKIALTKCIQRILSPFYRINDRRYERLAKEAESSNTPVFIIGHWRSGTTFVHNIFTQDEQFGYCTTYQTVFPHLMLWGYGFFTALTKLFMPNTRATDKMELGVDVPQEEEVALSNMTPLSHYHFLSLPQRMEHWRDKALLLNGLTDDERKEWQEAQRKLMRISLKVQGKQTFLSKNPPHTARIKALLEVWPDAKFIYLVRNPYTVFESTRNFFTKTIASTTLQPFDKEAYEVEVLKTYKALYERYEEEKQLIPEGNLVEVRFEDFEADPIKHTEQIYKQLQLGDFEAIRAKMEAYVGTKRGFKKNKYRYDERTIALVDEWCSDAIKQWGYMLEERRGRC